MATLEAFSTLGLDVQITELDVSLGTWQNILSATEENLRAQGQFYYELVSKIVEGNTKGTTKLSGITFWGFSEDYHGDLIGVQSFLIEILSQNTPIMVQGLIMIKQATNLSISKLAAFA